MPTASRVTRKETAAKIKAMTAKGRKAEEKEKKLGLPEGKTVKGKTEKFGGKQAPPFGKRK